MVFNSMVQLRGVLGCDLSDFKRICVPILRYFCPQSIKHFNPEKMWKDRATARLQSAGSAESRQWKLHLDRVFVSVFLCCISCVVVVFFFTKSFLDVRSIFVCQTFLALV